MSGLGLSGVFSGINTDALIAQLIAVGARPISLLEVRKTGIEEKISAVDAIMAQLRYLKNVGETLSDTDELQAMTANSSDTDIMSVSASAGALEGVHNIVINQLARSHTSVHNGLEAETTTVGSSTSNVRNVNGMADADATWFTTTANGATYTFDFGAEADMDSLTFAPSTTYS